METSYNGWPASPTLKTRVITPVPGRSFRIVDNANVAVIFTYLIQQFHKRVEPIDKGVLDDWGYAYRADRNDPSMLSCHASGTAVDLNATKHPNGVRSTFTAPQVTEIHHILSELGGTVAWGGDYHHTIDAMHFEINVAPGHLRDMGRKLRIAKVVVK
jgi:hypothetical protein